MICSSDLASSAAFSPNSNAEVTRTRHLVVGIGINVHQQQFSA